MEQRLIKLFLPDGDATSIRNAIGEDSLVGLWTSRLDDKTLEATILVKAEASEAALDSLGKRFSYLNGYRVLLLSVAASLPRPADEDVEEQVADTKESEKRGPNRISREELYSEAYKSTDLNSVYLVMVILSAVVAATGMVRDNVAVIIGAMVIAPLLGPNVALSLATALADTQLARRAASVSVVGVGVALMFSIAVGVFFDVSLASSEITSRTQVNLADVGLALAAGVAGALSFTTGISAALIGVMVAVALLPPIVAFGMLLGAGLLSPALGALLLFLCNVICVNLAGVGTFLIQGIKPATWREAERAKRATAAAFTLWLVLLAGLVTIVLMADTTTLPL